MRVCLIECCNRPPTTLCASAPASGATPFPMEPIPNRGAATWGWGFCETVNGHAGELFTCPGIACHCNAGHTPQCGTVDDNSICFLLHSLLHPPGVDGGADVKTSLATELILSTLLCGVENGDTGQGYKAWRAPKIFQAIPPRRPAGRWGMLGTEIQ
jgi:hypothetical protein